MRRLLSLLAVAVLVGAGWLVVQHLDNTGTASGVVQVLVRSGAAQGTRRAHKAAAVAIGRPSLTLHDLRRSGATLAGQSGATVRELMRFLGTRGRPWR